MSNTAEVVLSDAPGESEVDSDLTPVSDNEIAVGQTLEHSIWSADGLLLLPRGGIIESEGQRAGLLRKGYWHDPGISAWSREARVQITYDKNEDPFAIAAGLPRHIDQVFDAVLLQSREGESVEGFEFTFERLISKVDALARQWPDKILAVVHRPTPDLPYSTHHPMDHALLVGVLGRDMGFDQKARRSMIGAALLADVSLRSVRDALHQASGLLNETGRERLANHPALSRSMAETAGITDPLLLYLIAHHHRRAVTETASMPPEQGVVAFADAYTAMLTPRGDRPARDACNSFRTALAQDGHDPEQVRTIIATIGFYPPGASVRLSDGRYGVVTERGEAPGSGNGVVVLNASGHPLGAPLARFREGEGPTIKEGAEDCLPNASPSFLYREWERGV